MNYWIELDELQRYHLFDYLNELDDIIVRRIENEADNNVKLKLKRRREPLMELLKIVAEESARQKIIHSILEGGR